MGDLKGKTGPRFREPDEEVRRKLALSKEEYEKAEKKPLRCPVCGYKLIGASAVRSGLVEVKCQKCKFEGPMNLAYFRTQRLRGYHLRLNEAKERKDLLKKE